MSVIVRRQAASPPGSPPGAMEPAQRARRPTAISQVQLVQVAVAAAAALATVLVLRLLLDWGGLLGSVIWWYFIFLTLLYVLVRDGESAQVAVDRLVTVFIWSVGALVVAVLAWMVVYTAVKGWAKLRPGFFTQDLSDVGPLDPDAGGALHAIIGTLEQVALATVFVVPIAILTAIYLHEIRGRMAPLIRFIVDAMSGLPSIVAGLLVFALWVQANGFSGVAAAAALGILMLPTVTRASEEILRTVPDTLREGSLALGAPHWRMLSRVVLPTARAGLLTAVILGVARAIGETAPVILTALGSDTTNVNPFSGPQSDLPLFVWKLYRLPNQTQVDRAWTGALVLMLLVLVLFLLARFVGNRGAPAAEGVTVSWSFDEWPVLDAEVDEATVPVPVVTEDMPPPAPAVAPPANGTEPATLDTRAVSAWFGSRKVLESCSLRMSARRVTALIGPSGCGKSTFLRILNRMHETIGGAALAGSVELDGSDIYGPDLSATTVRKRIGMVFQKPNPFPAMSLKENVLAGLRLTGTKPADPDGVVERCLRRAGLWDETKDRLNEGGMALSGGQQQRLCIARSLAVEPQVLLMDEPCSALDPISTRVVEETIRQLSHEITIVIVTHNMQQAQRVSDDCAFFLVERIKDPGRIVEAGKTEKLFSSPDDQRTLDYVTGRFA